MIHCSLQDQVKSMPMNSISICRNFQHMDHITFKEDLVSELCGVPSGESPDQLLSRFGSAIIFVLDKHAPLKNKSHKLRPKQPSCHGIMVISMLRGV